MKLYYDFNTMNWSPFVSLMKILADVVTSVSFNLLHSINIVMWGETVAWGETVDFFFLLYMLINMGSFHQISMNQTFSVSIRSNT